MLSILNPASSISVLTRITNISSRSDLYGHIISVYRTCAVFDPADPCSFLFTLQSREQGSIPIGKCPVCGIFVFLACFCLVCLPQFQFLLLIQPSQTLLLLLSQTSSMKSRAPAFSSPSGHAHPQFLHLQTMLALSFSTHQAQ